MGRGVALVWLCLLWSPNIGQAGTLRLEVGEVVGNGVTIEGLRVELDDVKQSGALHMSEVRFDGTTIRTVDFKCPQLQLNAQSVDCRGAVLDVPGWIESITFDLSLSDQHADFALKAKDGKPGTAKLTFKREGAIRATIAGLSLNAFFAHIPALHDFGIGGLFDAAFELDPKRAAARLSMQVADGEFVSADGLQAAENLEINLSLEATKDEKQGWDWQAETSWNDGAAFFDPVYLTAGPVIALKGRLTETGVSIDARLSHVEGAPSISATAELDRASGQILQATARIDQADLALLGPAFIAPVMAPAHVDVMRFAGFFSAKAELRDDELMSADVQLEGAGFSLADAGLSFGPVSGQIPWRADGDGLVALSIEGGRWQKLSLGPFRLDARLNDQSLRIASIAIPILDGRLLINDLFLRRETSGWFGSGAAVIEPVSMRALTDALDLPAMSGVLSASMPALKLNPGSIALEGAMVISVFDGYLQFTELRVLEPFGTAPHVFGDLEARNLDLFQLTETFSFGSITGFLDADVQGLELIAWSPVRFDARLHSSPGDFPRRISQRAVENISALGGPGAAMAIQRGFLGLFDSFGYRELGVSCRLISGVCAFGGLGERPENIADGSGPFTIIQGGGIPSLNVIGYNRRVDWAEFMGRIERVIASNAAPVIE